MIFYFSATGNNKYVASKIAEATGDSTISILDGTTAFVWKYCILAAIGIVCYVIGSIRFRKKDLPL